MQTSSNTLTPIKTQPQEASLSNPWQQDPQTGDWLLKGIHSSYRLFKGLDRATVEAIAKQTGYDRRAQLQAFPDPDAVLSPIIGSGQYGTVSIIERVDDKIYLALKTLETSKAQAESARERAIQDKVKGLLNVLSWLDFIEAPDPEGGRLVWYQVMPLGGLGSLASLSERLQSLEDEALKQQIVAYIAKSLLLGLWQLHSRGIYHFDIKPANAVVNGQGNILLIDLGCALEYKDKPPLFKPYKNEDGHWVGLGDNEYFSFAREQAVNPNKPPFDAAKADLYALGLTLIEVYTGQRYYEPQAEEKALAVPSLGALIQALTAKEERDCPTLLQALNFPCLQSPSLHEAGALKAVTDYLSAFVRYSQGQWVNEQVQKQLIQSGYIREGYKITGSTPLQTNVKSGYVVSGVQETTEETNLPTAPALSDLDNNNAPPIAHVMPSSSTRQLGLSSHLKTEIKPRHTAEELTLVWQTWALARLQRQAALLETPALFIPLAASPNRQGDNSQALQAVVAAWQDKADGHTLLLLGEGGMGKSTFMARYLATLAQAVLQTITEKGWSAVKALPLYLPLNQAQQPERVVDVLFEGLDPDARALLFKDQPMLWAFDGYDELNQYANLFDLHGLYAYSLKLLISARPSALGEHTRLLLAPHHPDGKTRLMCEEWYMQPLAENAWELALAQYLALEKTRLEEQVNNNQLNQAWLTEALYRQAVAELAGLKAMLTTPLLLLA